MTSSKKRIISFSLILLCAFAIILLSISSTKNLPTSVNTISTTDTRTIGFIRNITEKNNEVYITFDEVKFYLFNEANVERIKDGVPESIVPYYIRNTTPDTVTYKLDKNCTLSLCSFIVNPNSTNSSTSIPVSIDTFKNYVQSNLPNDERALLFWINYKGDTISNVEMQYTP